MSKQNKVQELDHARKILHNPARYWNEETLAGRRGSLRRAEWVTRAAQLGAGKRVLEIGCGTGFFSEQFAKTGAALYGIDLSPELLAHARGRGLRGVEFLECDVERLPWPGGFFDAVVGIRVLHHLDLEAAFREIGRVLRDGGSIAFCEPNMMNPQILVQKNVPPIKRRMGDTPGETAFFRWGMKRFLEKRGYIDVSVAPFDFLHPWLPDTAVPFFEKAGRAAERLPLVREIAGSLAIFARRDTRARGGKPPTYVFKSPRKAVFAAALDAAGRALWRRRRRGPPSDPADVVVMRMDHLGDVVMAEPFLGRLKSHRPGLRLALVTSPLGARCLEGHPSLDAIIPFEADWFSPRPSFLRSLGCFFSLVRLLRSLKADAVIDLRGDARHIFAARIAKPRAWLASYGITGGAFLLDAEPRYDRGAHASARNLTFLAELGLEPGDPKTPPSPHVASRPLGRTAAALPPKTRAWIALHAGSGTPAKAWPLAHWIALVSRLAPSTDAFFYWIGDGEAGRRAREITRAAGLQNGRFVDLCGYLPVAELGTFLSRCDLLISSDSGPVHITAAHGVRTIVLFSGTNAVEEWRPLGDKARILSHPVPCSPCHLKVCRYERHYCMEGIEPEAVHREAIEALSGKG